MNVKTKKLLTSIAAILLNVFSVLLGIIVVVGAIASDAKVESFITVTFFGGYKTETTNVDEDEDIDTAYYKTDFESVAELNEYNEGVCQEVEAEGAVLLKNENGSLPLEKGSQISLFGATSIKPIMTVDAGADKIGVDGDEPNYKDALTAENVDLKINPTLYGWYESNYNTYKNPQAASNFQAVGLKDAKWSEISAAARDSLAQYKDAAIYIIGRGGNEGVDMQINGGSTSTHTNGDFLQLSVAEKTVIDQLKTKRTNGEIDNLIIIINSAAPLETNLLDDDAIDSILWIGMTGTSGVRAVGDILVGNVNPSGRLSDMWYTNNCYDPTLTNYGEFSYGHNYVVYQEGIYLGYRYAETRYEDVVMGTDKAGDFDYSKQIAYPFGYGLSYTEFDYSNFKVKYNSKLDQYTVSVTVTNKGDADGKEVVQVYLQQPYTEYDKTNHIEKPAVELVGFAKTTDILKANGGKQDVEVVVEGKYFASYDAYGIESYYLDNGDYYLTVGKDAHDATNNILAAKNYSPAKNAAMDADGSTSLVELIEPFKDNNKKTESFYTNASNTGYEIKNLFDNADPNRWGTDGGSNHVDYITRTDWAGTVKLAYDINHSKTNNLQATIKDCKVITDSRKLDHNGGVAATKGTGRDNDYPTYGEHHEQDDPEHLNLIQLRAEIGDAGVEEWIAYDDDRWDALLDQLTWEETVQLVANGKRKTSGIESISKPLTIDHNGSSGFAERLNANSNTGLAVTKDDPDKNQHTTGYPCSGIIAATFNIKLAQAVGNAMGEDSLWSGQAAVYGFGLNLHRAAYHGRYAAYYSADPYLTGVIAGYSSLGAWEKGCYVYNKHLIMNEQEVKRAGLEVYNNEECIRQMYLRPFEIAIDIGDAMCVMTAFSRVGAVWSGNHYGLCTEFLRNEAGMKGFAVTDWYEDAMAYMGIVGGILCGNDLPDGDGNNAEFENYGPGNGYAELAWAMRESAHRILYTVVHSNAMNGFSTGTRTRVLTPAWIGGLKAIEITIGVLFGLSAAAYITMWCLNKFLPEKASTTDTIQ